MQTRLPMQHRDEHYRRQGSRGWILAFALLMCAARGVAQQPGAGPQPSVTFSAETNFVEVHAIVTDETGAFVRNLTKDDFEILEDGKPQTPAAFSLIDLPIERPFTPAGGTEPVESDVRATTRTFDGRIYVFLLDDLHTAFTRTQAVRDAAKRFIQQYLGANDLAAVVYTSGRQESGQELTSSPRLLKAAIDRFQGQKLPSAGAEKLAIHIRQTDTDTVLADEPQAPRSREALEKAESIKDPYDAERGLNARRALQAVENVASWLRDVQGRRKALLLFSEGLDYDIYQPFNLTQSASAIVTEAREAAAAAQRANVNVYGIDPRGLSQFGELIDISARSDYPQLEYGTFRGALHELRLSQESLISLSEETGGLAVVNSNDVVGGLGRIVLDNSRYYLLGYYSDATKWSRKFFKIDVRVKRPGLSVRARRGFMPPDPRATAKAREADVKAGTTPALKAALSKPVPIGDLPLRLFAAAFKGGGSNGSLLLALEIDGSSLKFEERDGRFNEKIEVSIVAADQRARVQGGDRQEFNMSLQPATRERISRTGVRLLSRLELPPGRYQIHVGAHEASGATIGTVPYDLEIPDYAKSPFQLSGVVLTSSSADSFVTSNPDPLLKDALPSAPIVTRSFSPAETLTTYAEVYVGPGSARAVTMMTSVQDARDGRTVFQAQDRRAIDASARSLTHGFTTQVPLKNLSPGTYILRVAAQSSAGGDAAERSVPFEVR
jgi:VWFA-related protein